MRVLDSSPITSLSCKWRTWRGALLRHARPGSLLASTIVPQTQVCHADCFVGKSQTDSRERRSMKPVADMWSHQRLQSCLIDGRGACLEQAVVDSHRDVSIPCALDVFNSIRRFTCVSLASPCCLGVDHCADVNSCKTRWLFGVEAWLQLMPKRRRVPACTRSVLLLLCYYYYYLFNTIKGVQRKSNGTAIERKRKEETQWCPLSLKSHNNTVSCSGVYENVSANVIALNRCSVMEIR